MSKIAAELQQVHGGGPMPTGVYPRRVKRHAVTQPQDPSYRIIPLTKRQNALVDTADYEWLMQWNWFAAWDKNTRQFRAARTDRTESPKRTIKMARQILNAAADKEVDHWNGNALDNRRQNLRECTPAQNIWNTGRRRDATTHFKGVSQTRYPTARFCARWRAQIKVNGKNIWLGRFNSEEEAARAYDEAAKKYHGEFARLNFSS